MDTNKFYKCIKSYEPLGSLLGSIYYGKLSDMYGIKLIPVTPSEKEIESLQRNGYIHYSEERFKLVLEETVDLNWYESLELVKILYVK